MERIVIKPCPFCGNPATVREALQEERPKFAGSYGERWEWWIVECGNEYCLMHPKILFTNKKGAVSEWNTRRKANPYTYEKEENIIEVEEERI